ncbi:hypothetical protein S245_040542, partial [Arachis hypogaea]
PLISSTEAILEVENVATSFYLEESDLKALLAPCCFYNTHAGLEIVIFSGRKGSHCGVGPEWREGKPLTLFSGWIGIGKRKPENGWPVAELHVRVKLDPDARYVFQFEDFNCKGPSSSQSSVSTVKFTKDRISQIDPLSNYWC